MKSFKKFLRENSILNMYHVTKTTNLPYIFKEGLIPQIGDNSSSYGEDDKRIYLFPTLEDVEIALTGWLGELCDEDFYSLLEINVTGLNIKQDIVDWEAYTNDLIYPFRIKNLGDIDEFF